MKLRRLHLHGFKSFADRTEVRFNDGITAIVGPNGCGKSNISDAIRWVLGEQRASAIRGARMEEAIFQGTVRRRPVSRGSVALTVSNEEGILPISAEEVELSRTVYRDGGSEYAINRAPARLRDVQDLCRDTGLGAGVYSIIESRMIDAILSDRADERRALFEEAAGIGRYKDRKKGALRRLERAEADLLRIEDVIQEVRSKVRSLSRQKGKAERWDLLRTRRLLLEVLVAERAMGTIRERLGAIERLLAEAGSSVEARRTELAAAETEAETLRLRMGEAERLRVEATETLERTRGEVHRWERELAVARERETGSLSRRERIRAERMEADGLREAGERELAEVAPAAGRLRAEVDARAEELDELQDLLEEEERALRRLREELSAVEGREREVVHRIARLEGETLAAEGRGAEFDRLLQELELRFRESLEAQASLAEQGDLFPGRMGGLEQEVERGRTAHAAARTELDRIRGEIDAAQETVATRGARFAATDARVAALEALERDGEGVEPVVRALLGAKLEGVAGPLGEFMGAGEEVAGAVEEHLGVLLRAVIVEDLEAARRCTEWFRTEWEGGGGLLLLPLSLLPEGRSPLPEGVRGEGLGEPWVRHLLGGAEWVEEGILFAAPNRSDGEEGGERITRSGLSRSMNGIVRVGNPLGGAGWLERKARLLELRGEREEARRSLDEGEARLRTLREGYRLAEGAAEKARRDLREAEDALHQGRAELREQTERGLRAERDHEELLRRREATRAGRERAEGELRAGREELARRRLEAEGLAQTRVQLREGLAEVEGRWEVVRERESASALEHARQEGELRRLLERERLLRHHVEGGQGRMAALAEEEEGIAAALAASEETLRKGTEALRGLFTARDEGEELLRNRESVLLALRESLTEVEGRIRAARSSERESSEARHQAELEAGDLRARLEKIRDRLEGEWGRSLDELRIAAVFPDGEEPPDPREAETELREVIAALTALGPVNMLALEEHEEESARLEFLSGQREDLVRARDDLRNAIREINRTATERFVESFSQIRENFRSTYFHLFQGGECDLWLADPEDPLESPIEIHASPVGKRTQRIDLLSGGERALTALSLLFGIYLVKPSPFCVLDEVDAPLDESNIGRFIRLLEDFKGETQFVVITHNPRTIEAADWIYGVTMEEPGVSTIVGVRLEEAFETAGIAVRTDAPAFSGGSLRG